MARTRIPSIQSQLLILLREISSAQTPTRRVPTPVYQRVAPPST